MSRHKSFRIPSDVAIQDIIDFVEQSDNEEIEPLFDESDDIESDDECVSVSGEEEDAMLDVPNEEVQPQRHRKLLTWKRLVNSIDAALDPEN